MRLKMLREREVTRELDVAEFEEERLGRRRVTRAEGRNKRQVKQ